MTTARAKSLIRQSIIAQVQWMRQSDEKSDGYGLLVVRALLTQLRAFH